MQNRDHISEKCKLQAIERLHSEGCSCVITDGERFSLFHQRGVKDLYEVLCCSPELLRGAFVADKVVGKGAAALMILGGVEALHSDTISESALELLLGHNIEVGYGQLVPHIINRAGTGICPVELLCKKCKTAEECLPLIKNFIENNEK